MAAAAVNSAWLIRIVTLLFFFSGACALIYQVLWLRMLGLVFGVTVYAASTVWAAFMAGLAIGSLVGGRLAGRVRRPLLWFGVAEALVGVMAAATPYAQEWLQRGYISLYPSLPQSMAAMTAIRFVMAAVLLLPPTILMGITLPLVIRSALGRGDLGSRVGMLYGSNTAGAIAGTLAAGLSLIPGIGIQASFRYTAALNIAIGILAVICSWSVGAVQAAGPRAAAGAEGQPVEAGDAFISGRARRVVLWVFAVSGFTSLALEVIWFRVLVLFVRPTVYTFSLMLATILGGIALGSWAVSPFLKRDRNWLVVLAAIEVALAFLLLMSFGVLPYTQDVSISLYPSLSRLMPDYLPPIVTTSIMVMLPSTLLMGAAFPLGVKLWADGAKSSSLLVRRVGVFYSLNVCGGILGSMLAGFVLLPFAGSRTSLLGMATVTLLSGLALLAVARGSRRARLVCAAAAVVFVAAASQVPDPFSAFIAQRFPGESIIWREEGVQSTVSVNQFGRFHVMTLDGIHQASDTGGDAFIHHRIGSLAMAIHPNPRDALVVGLGGGATAGAVALHTGVNVDVVELSQAVAHAAPFFSRVNYDVIGRPNVRLRVDDGRNYLMLGRWKYDVITADIILPIHAGATNVYSREYFMHVRGALNEGGVVAQWITGTEAEYKMIMRTFLSVFPETTLWAEGSVMIGSVRPLRLSRSDFDWKLALPDRARGFREGGLASFDDLTKLFVAGPDELRRYVGSGPLLSDDRPMVEYFLSLPRDRNPDISGLKRDLGVILPAL